MKVTFTPNPMRIKQITDAQVNALGKTAGKLRQLIIREQAIPFRSGDLQNVFTDIELGEIRKGHVVISHSTPYATRLYFNPQFHFNRKKNKRARGEWWKKYISGSYKQMPKLIYMEYFKREAGV